MPRLNLEEVAEFVSDGRKVDWKRIEGDATNDDERQVLRNLRLVESLSEFHRPSSAERKRAGKPLPPVAVRWGDLEIIERLGSGAFGEVWRAWDTKLEREVALKLLRAGGLQRADSERVLHEARMLARVRHPNVVTVYGADSHDGRVGISMELVKGRSLARRMEEEGRLGAREAAILGVEVCRALAAVHAAGLVHRDVKAANVMREDGGRIVLMDFGAGSEAAAVAEGSISGTPQYIAPEVFAGQKSTPRADLYSLGVLLYHLVSGAYPVEARSLGELRAKIQRREVRLLRDARPDLPDGYHRVVERALAWDPGERFASAGALEQALAAFLGSDANAGAPAPPPEAARAADKAGLPRREWLWVAGGALVALLATVFVARPWLQSRGSARRPAEPSTQSAAGPAPVAASPGSPAAPVPAGAYTVEAALWRIGPGATRERIEANGRVGPGDQLALEFKASAPVHVYVINEDDAGHAYALFPLPGLPLQNPLPAGKAHFLPGMSADGRPKYWQVDSAGGREHLLVLASPERLVDFEAELNRLPRPSADASALAVPERAKTILRGIGGIVEGPAQPEERADAGSIFALAEKLAGKSEVAHGPWLRRIDLENPAPGR